MKTGVNFFGPCDARDSIGRAARLNVACLLASGVPYDLYHLPRSEPNEKLSYGVIKDNLLEKLNHRINIFHFNARRVPEYFSRVSEGSLDRFYNIGFWVHEMQTIPESWALQLKRFDEIWAPSSLCQNAIALSSNIPVLKLSYPIEHNQLSSRMKSVEQGCEFSEFNFLIIFDVCSDAERKNPLFAVRAFLNAYHGNKSVRLILKTRNLEKDNLLAEKLKSICKDNSNIEVIDGYMEEDDLNNLYERIDAYVSLHRAEGFGLTISDAMSRGIPVITTGYSGNTDFCNSDVRLVSYTLESVGHNRPRYKTEDNWAAPDMDDATEAFQDLVLNHSIWVRRAARARLRLMAEFSIDKIGDLMKKRIDLIGRDFTFIDEMCMRDIDFEVGISSTYGL